MRLFSAILLALLISTSVYAQNNTDEPIQPIGYVRYSPENQDYDISVMDVNTQEIIYSVATPDYDCSPSISPDNRYLSYSTGLNTRDVQGYIVNLETGESSMLPSASRLRWSRDSSLMVFEHYTPDTNFLYEYNLESGELIEIDRSQNRYSLLRLDGNRLYYSVRDGDSIDVYVWEDGESTQILTDQLPSGNSPYVSMSRDSHYLLHVIHTPDSNFYLNGSYTLFDLRTGQIVDLNLDFEDMGIPVWHPDSTRFVATANRRQLIMYDLADHSSRVIDAIPHEGSIGYRGWSPDGDYLVYSKFFPGGTDSESQTLLLYDVEAGTSVSFLSGVAIWAGSIRWISDAQFIYSYRDADSYDYASLDLTDLYVYDLESRQSTQLTDTLDIIQTCRLG